MGGVREIRRTFVLVDKERRKYKWEREKKNPQKTIIDSVAKHSLQGPLIGEGTW